MITLYHLGVSQSDRVVWLLEELGLPYNLEWYDREEEGLAPPEFLALHPTATSPIIRDGDVLLAESAAIVEYLCQRHGGGRFVVKPESPDYPDYLYWMQFNGNALAMFFVGRIIAGSKDEELKSSLIAKMQQRRAQRYYQYLDEHLASHKYLAGDELSCADIMTMFPLTAFELFGGRGIDDLPHVVAYVEKIKARPAYQKAMAIAGPAATRPD